MKTRKYLVGVATIGLATALASSPALANDDNDASDEVSLEAQGNFAGFRTMQSADIIVSTEIAIGTPGPAIERQVNGALVPAYPELIVRDDIGTAGAVDTANTLPSVVQIFRQSNISGGVFFNCTGTMINPRTVLTAAHCLNARGSEDYGLPSTGADSTMLVATGVDTSSRLFNYLDFGSGYNEGGVAQSTDVIIHPSANLENGALPFPWADVAFIALDTPITDVPAMPLLLTPLDELTHMIVTGYGTTGTGETGAQGIGFLRRVGENMLGAVATSADLIDTIFPGFAPSESSLGFETQALYWIDF